MVVTRASRWRRYPQQLGVMFLAARGEDVTFDDIKQARPNAKESQISVSNSAEK